MIDARYLSPVGPTDRIAILDVLRGFALLGILVINIEFFALPSAIYFDPRIAGGFDGLNQAVWKWSAVLFLEKMMAIFSMLFGAGIVLLGQKGERSGLGIGKTYYRRALMLLLIGLIHSYLFWHGDILVSYAICGLIVYLFRRKSAKTLLIVGASVLVFGSLIQLGSGIQFTMMRNAFDHTQELAASGNTPPVHEIAMAEAWKEVSEAFTSTPDEISGEVAAYRGGFADAVKVRAPMTFMMQTQAFLFMTLWRVSGLMLLGMGLMKTGFLSAARPTRTYLIAAAVGIVLGLPLCFYGVSTTIASDFDFVSRFKFDNHFNYFGSVLLAIAYMALLILLFKRGWMTGLFARLAAVGRMALTNYLAHTLICTTFFYGYGLGMFNRFDRIHLPLIVLAIWVLQTLWSRWWLSRFSFGPAEWTWRTATYLKRQPFRLTV